MRPVKKQEKTACSFTRLSHLLEVLPSKVVILGHQGQQGCQHHQFLHLSYQLFFDLLSFYPAKVYNNHVTIASLTNKKVKIHHYRQFFHPFNLAN
jgi:hypothetical protein